MTYFTNISTVLKPYSEASLLFWLQRCCNIRKKNIDDMEYRFMMTYAPTDGGEEVQTQVFPVRGDDVAVNIEKASDEWYYTRKMSGKLTFVRGDYDWMMARDLDGTYTLTVENSTDGGSSWREYFVGSFSRANLTIDEDNRRAELDGLSEGVVELIEKGKGEEYDLNKIIPDGEAVEVQGQVHPALALVDYRSSSISKSDMWCKEAIVGGGYDGKHSDSGFSEDEEVASSQLWNFVRLIGECQVKMKDGYTAANGLYANNLSYSTRFSDRTFPVGTMYSSNGYAVVIEVESERDDEPPFVYHFYRHIYLRDPNGIQTDINTTIIGLAKQSPMSLVFDFADDANNTIEKVTIFFHYIRAAFLTQSADGVQENILDTGDYYKGMTAFEGSGLTIEATNRTVERPNGHRLVPGTGEQGTTPQYFAPPEDNAGWIPLAEDNWNYGSMWYKIEPSVENGLADPEKVGTFRWTRCWRIGTCLRYLLPKVTGGKVTFTEGVEGSRFLYDTVNPVAGGEPFDYLVTQKSNVMHPAATGASRCIVTLNWFLELLRNAFNVYYWVEKVSDGYVFRAEHVEYFRRGGGYDSALMSQMDLTQMKPYRNFRGGDGLPVKRLSDQTNKYSYDLNGMTEKYTYSWQGDGGSDAFKGHPMIFKAGWVEKGSSESKEVDNIFADLAWLMLNAGTDTASSKNYDGLFIFAGYRPIASMSIENSVPSSQLLLLANMSQMIYVAIDIYLIIPEGQTVTLQRHWYQPQQGTQTLATYTGTGKLQVISIEFESAFIVPNSLAINFGAGYVGVFIYRIHARTGAVYNVANVRDLLADGVSYLLNGALAWPWLQNEYLHYDVPAKRWSYTADDVDEVEEWENNGTVKLVKKQTVGVVPFMTGDPVTDKGITTALKDRNEQKMTGLIESVAVNLGSRNGEVTLLYDPTE